MLVDNIKSVNPDILNRKIKLWDKEGFSELQPFIKERFWQDSTSVNIFRVVGTQHPDYAGLTWLEFLEKGKRMSLNLNLFESNPAYYDESKKKEPSMYYQSIDGGELYIADDGNHRTCIAKCAFYLSGNSVLHGITLYDYRIDWELKQIFEDIQSIVTQKRLPYFVSVVSNTVSRDDSGGWMLEKYDIRLKIRNIKKHEEFLMDKNKAVSFLEKIKSNGSLVQKIKSIFFFFVVVLSVFFFNPIVSIANERTILQTQEAEKPCRPGMRCGFWWYEERLKKPEEKKEEQKVKDKPARVLPSLKDFTQEQLWNMHPDDFQALLMDFKEKAVKTLSPDDVYEYYVMQDIARRKSAAFANVASYIVQRHPEFNVGKDFPIAAPGRSALVGQRMDEIENVIRNSQNDFALLFFHSTVCPYCIKQDGILRFFVDKYRWQIKRIDVNQNPSLAARFGIETTPTLLLIYRGSQDFIPVGSGVLAMSEIESNLFRGIRLLKGEITPQEWSLFEFQRGGTFDTGMPGRRGRF